MRATRLFFLMVTGLAATSAFADDIYLGEPGYGGTGCPQGTVSATLSPDAQSLTLIFDQYVAEAGGAIGKNLDRKTCNVAIPVHIPQGYSVSIFQIDYRGFNDLPKKANSTFTAEYFFGGSVGPKFTRNFVGPLDRQDFLFTNKLAASAVIWSECGKDVNLRTNTSLLVKTSPSVFQEAMAAVDSADVKAGIIYRLSWKKCF